MNSDLSGAIDAVLCGLDRLLALFKLERIIHLAVGIVAFFVLLVAAIFLLLQPTGLSTTTLAAIFGSSGVVTISSARITFFFNKAYTLYDDIVRTLLKLKTGDHGKPE